MGKLLKRQIKCHLKTALETPSKRPMFAEKFSLWLSVALRNGYRQPSKKK
jgi:hypothetical protein